jgi:hypothetical protein
MKIFEEKVFTVYRNKDESISFALNSWKKFWNSNDGSKKVGKQIRRSPKCERNSND